MLTAASARMVKAAKPNQTTASVCRADADADAVVGAFIPPNATNYTSPKQIWGCGWRQTRRRGDGEGRRMANTSRRRCLGSNIKQENMRTLHWLGAVWSGAH